MKKSTIIISLMLTLFKLQAQDYLISFAATGAASNVSTVKVDNLTSGATVTLNGGDILHLTPFVGIGKLNKNNETLQLYPNPMDGLAFLTFYAPGKGDALIRIVDLSGKTVYQMSKLLSPGTQSFRVKGIRQGVYLLKVIGEKYSYSAKLISLNNLQSNAGIEYVSSVNNSSENQLKSTESTIDMPYKEGDLLLFKSTTGQYSTIVTDVPTGNKTVTFNLIACTDADNNNYSTVTIGTQVWLAENLKTTKYKDGTSIPLVSADSAWAALSTPGYCWYSNDIANKNTYGALYNWYAVNTTKLAPAGWHVATDAEWIALATYLGGVSIAGGKLKETGITHWYSPNTGATNTSGFSALPGGYRNPKQTFHSLSYYGTWWSATQYSIQFAWTRSMGYYYADFFRTSSDKQIGYSVRCVKD